MSPLRPLASPLIQIEHDRRQLDILGRIWNLKHLSPLSSEDEFLIELNHEEGRTFHLAIRHGKAKAKAENTVIEVIFLFEDPEFNDNRYNVIYDIFEQTGSIKKVKSEMTVNARSEDDQNGLHQQINSIRELLSPIGLAIVEDLLAYYEEQKPTRTFTDAEAPPYVGKQLQQFDETYLDSVLNDVLFKLASRSAGIEGDDILPS